MRRSYDGEQQSEHVTRNRVEDVRYGGSIRRDFLPLASNDNARSSHQSRIVSGSPVYFERNVDPNRYLNTADIHYPVEVQVVDKPVDRLVEVFNRRVVSKPAERTVEKIEIHDEERTKELPLTQIVPEIEYIDKEVYIDREVLKEEIEEVYVDKYVERVVEVLREVPVDKIVERRIEVIKEIPVVRYVDRVVTKEVPVVQVVERVVEVTKERPVEISKEVPVYVRRDASDTERNSISRVSTHTKFGGVGMRLAWYEETGGRIYVCELIANAPAASSRKVRIGDIVVSVNGNRIQGHRLEEVNKLISGPIGTPVHFELQHEDGNTEFVTLIRQAVYGSGDLTVISK